MSCFVSGQDLDVILVKPSSYAQGEGVFATRDLAPNETIFEEIPLEKFQDISNRAKGALVCGNCFKFVGSALLQLELQAGMVSRQEISSSKTHSPPFSSVATPDCKRCEEDIPFSGLLPCRDECGEVYCSETCSEEHWCRSHRLLCTGRIPDEEANTHPLMAFKIHAIQTNEIFLMVADLFARICLRVEHGVPVPEAVQPYQGFVREKWWDAIATSDPSLARTLEQLTKDTWRLFDQALHLTERGLDSVLTEEFLACTMGMFEQNNVGIFLRNPAAEVVSQIVECNHQSPVGERLTWRVCEILRVIHQQEIQMEEEEEEDRRTTPDVDLNVSELLGSLGGLDSLGALSGTAFYSRICKINHSCDPNVKVTYRLQYPGCGRLIAVVQSTRPIRRGEELFHSYIDVNDDVEMRRAALKDYGFQCSCLRCEAESH